MRKYLAIGLGLILFALFFYVKGCVRANPGLPSPAILKPGDKEEILVDPTRHTITIVTPHGVTQTTLPDKPSTITLRDNGDVKVSAPQIGFQHRPFIGLGFANKWRFIGGCDLFYFKKLDFGPGLSFEPNQPFDTMRLNALLSYNVWSNTRVGVGIDHLGQFSGFVSVRL